MANNQNRNPNRSSQTRRFDKIAAQLPQMGNDPAAIRQRIELLEGLLERAFVLPGTSYRVGFDAVLGLIPGVGDLITGAMGAYLIWEARNLKMSKWTLWRMAGNVGVDTLLGAIPLVGDAFDLVFKSNSKNFKLIKRHLERHHPSTVTIDA